jgi:hypothetical protein
MALSFILSASMEAQALGFGESASAPVTAPKPPNTFSTPNNLLVFCYLNAVSGGDEGFGSANVFITKFISNGVSFPNGETPPGPGPWKFMPISKSQEQGGGTFDNVSEVEFTLNVFGASAQAVGVVFAM